MTTKSKESGGTDDVREGVIRMIAIFINAFSAIRDSIRSDRPIMSGIRIRDGYSLIACCVGTFTLIHAAAWSAEPPSTKRFPLVEMRFPDERLGEKFRRFDATCNSFAKSGWHCRPYQPFDSLQARGVYFAEWASFAEKGRNPINYCGPNEMHCLSMSAYFDADAPDPASREKIVGLGIGAVWNPPETGWRTAVDYYTMHGGKYPRSGQPMETCEILWNYHQAKGEALKPGLRWSQSGMQSYSQAFTFGGKSGAAGDFATLYQTSISNEPVRGSLMPLDADVCRFLKSPESLRDHLLVSNQQLLDRVKAELSAGRGVREASRIDRLSPPENAPANYSRSSRPLTATERETVTAAAVAEIQSRIDVIQSDFQSLYESVNRAFPLRQCLETSSEPKR